MGLGGGEFRGQERRGCSARLTIADLLSCKWMTDAAASLATIPPTRYHIPVFAPATGR